MAILIRKQPSAADDYQTAHELINNMKIGNSKTVEVSNVKAFRKYLSDLGSKNHIKFTTRKDNGSLFIMRIL